MSHRRAYDRADEVALGFEKACCWIFLAIAGAVILSYVIRAAVNFDSWKWMVQ